MADSPGTGAAARRFESFAELLGRRGKADVGPTPATQNIGGTPANTLRLDETPTYHHEPAEIDGVIDQHGLPCEVRRVIPCPCARPDHGGSFPSSCPDCAGTGRYYPEQLRARMQVLVVGASLTGQQGDAGGRQMGRVGMTFPTAWTPRAGDMVLPEGQRYSVTEQLRRAALDADPRDLPGDGFDEQATPPELLPALEQLKHHESVELEAITWRGADKRALLGREGLDFELSPGGRITWRTLRGPAPGAVFSVRYSAPVAYVVGVDISPRSDAGIRLPFKVSGLRLDFTGGEGDP